VAETSRSTSNSGNANRLAVAVGECCKWRLADRYRHQLHSDPRASYRADPAVRDTGAGAASTISTTRRRPRPNSIRPRLLCTPTRSRATEKQRRALRRCATFTDRCQAAGGARRPGGSTAAAASRRTISRARCRVDSRACRRRALAGSARPGRQNPRDPRGSRCG
jgi:hypothetical protein